MADLKDEDLKKIMSRLDSAPGWKESDHPRAEDGKFGSGGGGGKSEGGKAPVSGATGIGGRIARTREKRGIPHPSSSPGKTEDKSKSPVSGTQGIGGREHRAAERKELSPERKKRFEEDMRRHVQNQNTRVAEHNKAHPNALKNSRTISPPKK